MSREVNFFTEGEYYHLYNRGVEKREIFSSDYDRNRFLMLLYLCNSKENVHISNLKDTPLYEVLKISKQTSLVDVGAYCLMPNHFHLLIKEKETGGVSKFMQKLSTAYTMYFNKKYERSGSLFQGVFRAEHCDSDNYLKYIYAYIHLNPIKLIQKNWKEEGIKDLQKAEKQLNNYKYSSYKDYCGETSRPEKNILDTIAFPKYFMTPKDFKTEINDWLNYQNI